MSTILSESEIKRRASIEFLSDCSDDEWAEELWKLIWIIRYIMNGDEYPTDQAEVANSVVVQRIALNVIEELLRSGQIQAWFTNYPITDTYQREPATSSVGEILKRIATEWDALGREPSMCEIAAFSAAPNNAANQPVQPSARDTVSRTPNPDHRTG